MNPLFFFAVTQLHMNPFIALYAFYLETNTQRTIITATVYAQMKFSGKLISRSSNLSFERIYIYISLSCISTHVPLIIRFDCMLNR